MANSEKKFDKLFRDKLLNHEETPSKLAWEKLEHRLNEQKKGGIAAFPWMQMAAAFVLLLGMGYIIWQNINADQTPLPQLAEVVPAQDEEPEIVEGLLKEEQSEIIPDKTEAKALENKKSSTGSSSQQFNESQKRPSEPKNDFIASTERERELDPIISVPELSLPDLDLHESIALQSIEEQPNEESIEDEVPYKITIKSSGLKDDSQKPGLIGEIENKVDKIGGFLNKVEQGFADLQDAKANLFASNTPKKERSK